MTGVFLGDNAHPMCRVTEKNANTIMMSIRALCGVVADRSQHAIWVGGQFKIIAVGEPGLPQDAIVAMRPDGSGGTKMELLEFIDGVLTKSIWMIQGVEIEHIELPFLPFNPHVHLNFLIVIGCLAGRIDQRSLDKMSLAPYIFQLA
jgi:hypothetical protein